MSKPPPESPVPDPIQAPASNRVEEGAFCITCGYRLEGLYDSGVCPECGTPIEDSLRGNLLVHRSREYVGSLRRGLSFILNGILLWLTLIVGGFIFGIVASMNTSASGVPSTIYPIIQIGIEFGGLVISAAILYGWWSFTTRDPADPVRDGAPTARKVVRGAVIAEVVFKLIQFASGAVVLAFPITSSGPGTPPPITIVMLIVSSIAGIGGFAAFATQFFAGMLYVRSLAPRLPDPKVHRLAKTRMIGCPIWATVGLVILIGPLVAIVLYWNLLNMVQTNIKRIMREQRTGTV